MNYNDINTVVLQKNLQYTDIGIHVIDKNRKTIIYNEAMQKLEGLDLDQVLDKDLLNIFPDLKEDTSTLIRVLNTKEIISDKTQIYTNLKGQKIYSINTTIPLIFNNKIIGALEMSKDITYYNKLSSKIIDLQQELNINKRKKLNYKNNKNKYYKIKDIIGKSQEVKNVIDIAMRTKNSPSSVFIYGETGTGKELIAQSMHSESIRKAKPFIAQNCAAIPDALLEGILFGTEKGGFTGSIQREGIFEQANDGTLLLDEINSMSIRLQAKLLRVLQEGYLRRIGGTKDIPVNVKIIATTNEEPIDSIKNGNLRKDLYYRLNVVYIKIPPLRERIEDIPTLCEHFINKHNFLLEKKIMGIDEEVLKFFNKHSWNGNVRELENLIESAMNYSLSHDGYLQKKDFISFKEVINELEENKLDTIDMPLLDYLDKIEKQIIKSNLVKYNYNITKVAKILGIKRQTLQYKIKKYSIKVK